MSVHTEVQHFTHPALSVRKSALQGHGLFADSNIPAGTLLCTWSGEVVHRADVPALSDNAKRYLIRLRNTDSFVNGEPLVEGLLADTSGAWRTSVGAGFMANAAENQQQANCKQVDLPLNQYNEKLGVARVCRMRAELAADVIVLVARKDVARGEELLWQYSCQ